MRIYTHKNDARGVATFFTNAANDECFYHSGKFVEPKAQRGTEVGWTCCRSMAATGITGLLLLSIPNQAALQRNSKGCKQASKHIEDLEYSKMIQFFPFEPTRVTEWIGDLQPEEEKTTQNTLLQQRHESMKDCVPHEKHLDCYTIQKNDTLVGIALKFGISVSELQKLNRLPNQGIFHLKTLLVPMKNEEIPEKSVKSQNETDHQHILIQFQKKTHSSTEESKIYLEQTDYNLETALKEWEQDQSGRQQSLSCSSIKVS